MIKFPKNFFWGTVTSAHQVEGGNRNDWSEWEKKNAVRLSKEAKNHWQKRQREKFPEMFNPENYISGIACDHYNRYEEDFGLAKAMNNSAHRFSIEWSRIEPEEGRFDENEIEHYRRVIKSLRDLNLEPFATLWHWAMPVWFSEKGGFQKKSNIGYFARYCERIVKEFNGEIKFWITVNEPEIYSLNSYVRGLWPPQNKSLLRYFRVNSNLAKAHKMVFKKIHLIDSEAKVGIAKSNSYFEGWAAPIAKWLWNDYFLKKIKNHQDFVGLNYYFHNRIRGFKLNQNENEKNSDLGHEIYPEGIYYVLKDLKKYQKPVYITENGLADRDDDWRIEFIKNHLKYMHKAIEEGADVKGYFHWSLLDNFEWDKGFWPRFGLIEVDRETLKRKPRPSSKFYGAIAGSNGFNEVDL